MIRLFASAINKQSLFPRLAQSPIHPSFTSLCLKYSFFSKKKEVSTKQVKQNVENKEVFDFRPENLQAVRKVLIATGAAVSATHLISVASIYSGVWLFFPLAGIISLRAFVKLEGMRIQEYLKENTTSAFESSLKSILSGLYRIVSRKGVVQEPSMRQKLSQYGWLMTGFGICSAVPFLASPSLLMLSPALFFSSAYLLTSRIKDEDDVEDSTYWALRNVGLPNYILNAGIGALTYFSTGSLLFFSPVGSLFLCAFWSWVVGQIIKGTYLHKSIFSKQDLLYLTLLPLERCILSIRNFFSELFG